MTNKHKKIYKNNLKKKTLFISEHGLNFWKEKLLAQGLKPATFDIAARFSRLSCHRIDVKQLKRCIKMFYCSHCIYKQ
jgi:hypothetical protein